MKLKLKLFVKFERVCSHDPWYMIRKWEIRLKKVERLFSFLNWFSDELQLLFFHRRLEQEASPRGDDCPSVDSSAFSGFPYCSLTILSTLIIPYNSLSFLSIPYHSWLFHIIHCHSLPFLIIPFLMVPRYSLPFLINRYYSIPLLVILYHCKSKYKNLLKRRRIWNWSTGCEWTIQKWNEVFPGVKKCQVKGSPLSGCQVYRWSYFQNDDDDRNNTKFFNWFSRYAKSKRPSPMWHNVQENSACSWKSTPMTKKANPGAESFRSDVDWAPGSSWSTGASGPRVVLYSGRSFSLNMIWHIFL